MPQTPNQQGRERQYTKRPKELMSAEETVSMIRTHLTIAHRALLRKVVIWVSAALLVQWVLMLVLVASLL